MRIFLFFAILCAFTAIGAVPENAALDFQGVIQAAKEKVFPAVVYIRAVRENPESGDESANVISGSGVVIDPSGEILTNHHVIDRVIDVRCLLEDGRSWPAEIIGGDKELDIALIRLLRDSDDTVPLPTAVLDKVTGQTEGDFVMAMGAPWGMNRSVSIGIISCASRYLNDKSQYSLWYQTDAVIFPGNSGGPLVNISGNVIGINTLGGESGIGFAVPAATIMDVLPGLREFGAVNWSWYGINFQPLRDFNRNIYFPYEEGVIVASTEPNSPAREAGIFPNDRIVAVNGNPVTAVTEEQLPDFRRMLALLPLGEPVVFSVARGEEMLQVEIVPKERGAVGQSDITVCKRWGLSAAAINRFDTPNLFFYQQTGVYIAAVSKIGNAVDAGLVPGDIIVSVNGVAIDSIEDLLAEYDKAVKLVFIRPRADIVILRNGQELRKIMDFSKVYDQE